MTSKETVQDARRSRTMTLVNRLASVLLEAEEIVLEFQDIWGDKGDQSADQALCADVQKDGV